MNLYEIENEILACVDFETGEILDVEKFEALGLERDKKLTSIACWIKNLQSDVEALKREKQTFEERIKSKERKVESLKNYLSGSLNGQKYENERCKVSFRKTQSVVVDNLDDIGVSYLRFKTTREADKKAIADAIKNGEVVEGAHLEDGLSMTVR